VTNTRGFCHFGMDVSTAMIEDDAVTLAKMAANSVDSDQYVDGSIDLAHMAANSIDSDQYVDNSIDQAHMGANSVDSAQYVDASIDTAHLAADSVDDTKVGNRVPALTRRQGGSATNWNTAGTTGYTPTTVRMQTGVATVTTFATITFPTAFSAIPLVLVSLIDSQESGFMVSAEVIDAASCYIYGESGVAHDIAWLAIGPE